MDETPDCERVRPLLAELATGAATGHDRAQALRHVAGCPTCRHELAVLARVADDLLLLTPEREPPAGFETAVVQRILGFVGADLPRRRAGSARLRDAAVRLARGAKAALRYRLKPRKAVRLVAAITVLVLAATGGAAAALWRTAPDRQLADRYRQTLALAGGRYLKAALMTTDGGAVVGHVFLYQGSPSWIMVVLTAAPEPGSYTMSVVTIDGTRYPAGVCPVTGQSGTVGYPLPVPVARIAAIELTRPGVRLIVHPT